MGATKNKAKPPSSPAQWLVLAIAGTGLLGCSPRTGQPTPVMPGSPENEPHLTLKDRASLPHRWFVNSVAFSADGKRLATGAGERGKPGDVTVWDSLAISEYLHEKLPEKRLWPKDAAQRARARSVAVWGRAAAMPRGQGAGRKKLAVYQLAAEGGPGGQLVSEERLDRGWGRRRGRH